MALADFSAESTSIVANPVAAAFAAAARAVAAWRAERAGHLALGDLLGMEPCRLRDLGINPYDIQQALAADRTNRK